MDQPITRSSDLLIDQPINRSRDQPIY